FLDHVCLGADEVVGASGSPYKVFTPFSRAWLDHGWPAPAQRPAKIRWVDGGSLDDAADAVATAAQGTLDFAAGEEAALARWADFLDGAVDEYAKERDHPAVDGTSKLSPYLKLGVLHPRTLLADLARKRSGGASTYRSEIAWREFYADVLWHNPRSAWHDLRDPLASMQYDEAAEHVQAWKSGETGYPIVDAGMRQLLATGWMHNRVRMITASFLTKDLHVWWTVGARHFMDHLVDGDIASNNHGWQWVAGTGTDASPYFRVFNPITQGQKFDPTGDYVRRWVPELRHLSGKSAHEPWRADDGYEHDYPRQIVDHAVERKEALSRYESAR
ncbi:MAG: deoxyribodipyrimidine photo-lyase, partial [Allobranchiibius sp.]